MTANESDVVHRHVLDHGPDHSFLLRWCLSNDPDDFGLPPGEPGRQFDVTASRDLVERLLRGYRRRFNTDPLTPVEI